jgi:putative chitinase
MIEKLKGNIPDYVYDELQTVATQYKIDTVLRIAHFISQCAHESGDFKFKSENLNYGAQGLLSVFKKYFPTNDIAIQYERKPEKIANKVYANRMGNGDEASGEGFAFRGRGFIQLTGKSNYSEFDKVVSEDLLLQPDLVASKYPLLSAAFFWNKTNLNSIADLGSTDEVVTKVTKKINGGTHGLANRISKFKLYFEKLNANTTAL